MATSEGGDVIYLSAADIELFIQDDPPAGYDAVLHHLRAIGPITLTGTWSPEALATKGCPRCQQLFRPDDTVPWPTLDDMPVCQECGVELGSSL